MGRKGKIYARTGLPYAQRFSTHEEADMWWESLKLVSKNRIFAAYFREVSKINQTLQKSTKSNKKR